MIPFFKHFILGGLIFAAVSSPAQPVGQPNPLPKPERVADGVIFLFDGTYLKLEVWADNVVRVVSAKDPAFFAHSSPATEVRQKLKTSWKLATDKTMATLSTAKVRVRVDLVTGAVSFFDPNGQPVLAEKAGSRSITPAEVQGEKTFHVSQQWMANADESLYGLGQLQFGTVDIKGYDLDLWQHTPASWCRCWCRAAAMACFGTISLTRASATCDRLNQSLPRTSLTPPASPAA